MDTEPDELDWVPDAGGEDPYAVLGIRPGATRDDIKSASKRLSLRYHPDRLSQSDQKDPTKVEVQRSRFELINRAKDYLLDEAKGNHFDVCFDAVPQRNRTDHSASNDRDTTAAVPAATNSAENEISLLDCPVSDCSYRLAAETDVIHPHLNISHKGYRLINEQEERYGIERCDDCEGYYERLGRHRSGGGCSGSASVNHNSYTKHRSRASASIRVGVLRAAESRPRSPVSSSAAPSSSSSFRSVLMGGCELSFGHVQCGATTLERDNRCPLTLTSLMETTLMSSDFTYCITSSPHQ